MRHINADAPSHTFLTYLPHNASELTWHDGYDGVFLECETKRVVWLAPDLLSSMLLGLIEP